MSSFLGTHAFYINLHPFAVKKVEKDKLWKSVHKLKFKSGYIIVCR
jgi:hypothetical protein